MHRNVYGCTVTFYVNQMKTSCQPITVKLQGNRKKVKVNFTVYVQGMNFILSEAYRSVNYIGSRAKWMNPFGVHVNFARDPVLFTLR